MGARKTLAAQQAAILREGHAGARINASLNVAPSTVHWGPLFDVGSTVTHGFAQAPERMARYAD